jgi:hypothetical protein
MILVWMADSDVEKLPYLCKNEEKMKRVIRLWLIVLLLTGAVEAVAQCSICTKTAQQLGHKPAKGLNTGIIYLMLTPFAIMGFVGYRYFKANK